MTENEYILLKNLTGITNALAILRDVLPDFDGIVTKKELYGMQSQLAEWQEKAYKKIRVSDMKVRRAEDYIK